MTTTVVNISVFCFSVYVLKLFVVSVAANPAERLYTIDDVLEGTEVVMFNSVFRHGNRTPDPSEVAAFPNSPYNESIFFPHGLGQLNEAGKVRAYALGQHLRRRYNDLLSPLYLVDQIRMRTTEYDRTKASGMLVFAGLYPPQNLQSWNDELDWQPIPFDTTPLEDDFLVAISSCPQLKAAFYARLGSPDVVAKFDTFSDVTAQLSDYSGADVNGFTPVIYLYQMLLAQMGVGSSIPDWAVDLLPNIKEINDIGLSVLYSTDELVTLSGGTLLNEMLTNMRAAAECGAPTGRAYLYSAHDLTVGALLAATGVFDGHQPVYSSMYTLELRKETSTGEYGVVALYTRDPLQEPEAMLIPGCPQIFCPLDTFAVVASKYATTEEQFNELCVVAT